jgi:hypothetical protein
MTQGQGSTPALPLGLVEGESMLGLGTRRGMTFAGGKNRNGGLTSMPPVRVLTAPDTTPASNRPRCAVLCPGPDTSRWSGLAVIAQGHPARRSGHWLRGSCLAGLSPGLPLCCQAGLVVRFLLFFGKNVLLDYLVDQPQMGQAGAGSKVPPAGDPTFQSILGTSTFTPTMLAPPAFISWE